MGNLHTDSWRLPVSCFYLIPAVTLNVRSEYNHMLSLLDPPSES